MEGFFVPCHNTSALFFTYLVLILIKLKKKMSTLRDEVLAFLANLPTKKEAQYNTGFALYRKTLNKNKVLERRMNNGYSAILLNSLLYELKKLHNIKEVDIARHASIVNEVAQSEPVDEEAFTGKAQSKDVVGLRDEFPFLNDKDCPQELYIVVGKKIAAHKRYQALHEQIRNFDPEKQTEEELSKLTAEADEAFRDNKTLWNELDHYKTKGEILGDHPSLIEYGFKKEVDAMNNDDLMKFIQSSKTYFSRKKKELKEAKNDDDKNKINNDIHQRELKLKLVQAKLNL